MCIAVIGSGAAAAGVMNGLAASGKEGDVFLFDIGRNYPIPDWLINIANKRIAKAYAPLYRDIKHKCGLHFPPSKTYFGLVIERVAVNGKERFYTSNLLGGMTNLWGGLMLPFRGNDFLDWPIQPSILEPHYQAISGITGIAGEKDELTDYYRDTYVNRPPVQVLEGIKGLKININRKKTNGAYRAIAGTSCIAGETRYNKPNRCMSCGECMAGCLMESVYSARTFMEQAIIKNKIRFIRGKVVRVLKDRTIEVLIKSEKRTFSGFSKIFLCAGCVGTTEILMRSLGIDKGPVLLDNAVYSFPILNFSTHSDPVKSDYVALANSVVRFDPINESDFPLHLQLYPNADYLWRNALPEWIWPGAKPFARYLRDRIIIGRLYLHSRNSFHFESHLKNDRMAFSLLKMPDKRLTKSIWKQVRKALNGRGYYVPGRLPHLAETSGQLAGTFRYGGSLVNVETDGQIMPGVHIADSSCFPHGAATPPGFTIMANARRTAMEAVAS